MAVRKTITSKPSEAGPASEVPQRLRFSRGSAIPIGDRNIVPIILSGLVRLIRETDGGKIVTLDIIGPGDLLGESMPDDSLPIDDRFAERLRALALDDTEVLSYSAVHFANLLSRNSEFLGNVCRQNEIRRIRIEKRLSGTAFKSSIGKVAYVLAELAGRFGDEAGGAIRIRLRLTHKDIGSFIGVKRETVTLAMSELEYRELIRAKPGIIDILDPDKLLRVG